MQKEQAKYHMLARPVNAWSINVVKKEQEMEQVNFVGNKQKRGVCFAGQTKNEFSHLFDHQQRFSSLDDNRMVIKSSGLWKGKETKAKS